MPRIARRPFTVAPAAPGVELFDRPSALELEPLQRDRFEGVGVAQRLRLRGDATLHGRVAAIAQYRLGRVAFRARVEQRHRGVGAERSEEHTSELQSLMRISYAVLCLKKKIKNKLQHN